MPTPIQASVCKPRHELLYSCGDSASTIHRRNAIIHDVLTALFPDTYRVDTIECCALLRVICRDLPPEKHLLLQVEGLVTDDDTKTIHARSGEPITATLILDKLLETGLDEISVYLPDHPDPAARYSWMSEDA